jgi:hypothetical protein
MLNLRIDTNFFNYYKNSLKQSQGKLSFILTKSLKLPIPPKNTMIRSFSFGIYKYSLSI